MNSRKCLCGCAALVNLNSEWVCAACADTRIAALRAQLAAAEKERTLIRSKLGLSASASAERVVEEIDDVATALRHEAERARGLEIEAAECKRWKDKAESAETALAAARTENERLRHEVEYRCSQLEPWMRKAEVFEAQMHKMAELMAVTQPAPVFQLDAEASKQALAALRARPDDGRVEREAEDEIDMTCDVCGFHLLTGPGIIYASDGRRNNCPRCAKARAVLAAADGAKGGA